MFVGDKTKWRQNLENPLNHPHPQPTPSCFQNASLWLCRMGSLARTNAEETSLALTAIAAWNKFRTCWVACATTRLHDASPAQWVLFEVQGGRVQASCDDTTVVQGLRCPQGGWWWGVRGEEGYGVWDGGERCAE